MAASTILMNIATAQAEEQTKKLIEKAKQQASTYQDLSGIMLDVEDIFSRFKVILEPIPPKIDDITEGMKEIEKEATGKSLDRSLITIINLFDNLKRSSESLRNLSIKYNIEGTEVLQYESRALSLPSQIMNIQRIMPEIVKKGDLTLNISFPNLIVREEADINTIVNKIDSIFQANYYGEGGRINV